MVEPVAQTDSPLNIWEGAVDEETIVVSVRDLSPGLYTDIPLPLLPNGFSPNMNGLVIYRSFAELDHHIRELTLDTAGLPGETATGYKYPIYIRQTRGGDVQLLLTNKSLFKQQSGSWVKVPWVETPGDTPDTDGITLDGRLSINPSWDYDPASERLFFTNGVDTPFYFDGTNVQFIDALTTEFTIFKARIVVFWFNILFFCDTIEGTTRRSFRVRYSDTANIDDWTGGTAGHTDLLDTDDPITAARSLGQYLVVYRRNSLVRCAFEGSDVRLFDFSVVIQTDGPITQHHVVRLYNYHIFVGRYGVYVYVGGFDTSTISQAIAVELQQAIRTTQPVCMFVDNRRRLIGIIIPKTDTSTLYSVHIPPGRELSAIWSRRILDRAIDTCGEIVEVLGKTWDDLDSAEHPWDGYLAVTWDDLLPSIDDDAQPALVTYGADPETLLYSPDALADEAARTWEYYTKQHYFGDRGLIIQSIFLVYNSSGDVRVSVIGDAGSYEIAPGFISTDGQAITEVKYLNQYMKSMQLFIHGSGFIELLGYGFAYTQPGVGRERIA